MKTLTKLGLIALAGVSLFASCKKDEDEKPKEPVISNFNAEAEGTGGTTVNIGSIISFEFEIEAQGEDKLASYHLEIHNEAETEAEEFVLIDETFTDGVEGLRNTHIHEHIDVDHEAPEGTYHFHVTVTTKDGYTVTEDIELNFIINPQAPEITDFTLTNKAGVDKYAPNDTVVISFIATAAKGMTLEKYNLEIHDEPASGLVEDETKIVDDAFTDNFIGEASASINHEVVIPTGAKGVCHVHLIIFDQQNNAIAKASHFEVE